MAWEDDYYPVTSFTEGLRLQRRVKIDNIIAGETIQSRDAGFNADESGNETD